LLAQPRAQCPGYLVCHPFWFVANRKAGVAQQSFEPDGELVAAPHVRPPLRGPHVEQAVNLDHQPELVPIDVQPAASPGVVLAHHLSRRQWQIEVSAEPAEVELG
jgi:hypothetical protein